MVFLVVVDYDVWVFGLEFVLFKLFYIFVVIFNSDMDVKCDICLVS